MLLHCFRQADQPPARNRAPKSDHAHDLGNEEPRPRSNLLAARDGVDVLRAARQLVRFTGGGAHVPSATSFFGA